MQRSRSSILLGALSLRCRRCLSGSMFGTFLRASTTFSCAADVSSSRTLLLFSTNALGYAAWRSALHRCLRIAAARTRRTWAVAAGRAASIQLTRSAEGLLDLLLRWRGLGR